jgi:LysM repeat protein
MQPYTIGQGDFLLLLASKLGFDANTVWRDPSNANLAALRANPNILFPGDVLQVPDTPAETPATSLSTGTTNSFVSSAPTATLTHQFVGDDTHNYASQAYTVQELDQLTGLTTDANGVVTFEAPVTLDTATIVFTESGETWTLAIGELNPIDTLSGLFQRLQGLGHIDPEVEFDNDEPLNNLGYLRLGLLLLQASQGESSPSSPPSSPASTPPASSPRQSGPPPASSPTPASGASAGSPGSTSAGSAAPSSSSGGAGLTGGLADGGTLDADTMSLVLKVYGC